MGTKQILGLPFRRDRYRPPTLALHAREMPNYLFTSHDPLYHGLGRV